MGDWKAGMFALKPCAIGTPFVVRLVEEPTPGRFGIEYMQDHGGKPKTAEPYQSGGYCWCVDAVELQPITDPVAALRCELTALHRENEAARKVVERTEEKMHHLRYSLGIIAAAAERTSKPSEDT